MGSSSAPPIAKPRMAPRGPPRPSQSSITTSQPTPIMVPKPSEKKSASRSLRAREIMDVRGYPVSDWVGKSRLRSALQVRQHLFELRRPRRPQQLVNHHLRGGDDGAGGTHAIDADVPVPAHARTDSIGRNVHQVAFVQGTERSLHHADVRLHPTEQHGIAITRHRLQCRAKLAAAKATKFKFVDRPDIADQ